jgi:hypothetical protein
MDDEVQPMVSASVRRLVEKWEGHVPDEYGACHIIVSDFNVSDFWLGCCYADHADEACQRFIHDALGLTEGERLAVVLRLAGRTEESLLSE